MYVTLFQCILNCFLNYSVHNVISHAQELFKYLCNLVFTLVMCSTVKQTLCNKIKLYFLERLVFCGSLSVEVSWMSKLLQLHSFQVILGPPSRYREEHRRTESLKSSLVAIQRLYNDREGTLRRHRPSGRRTPGAC